MPPLLTLSLQGEKAFIEKAKEIGADEKSKADDLIARVAKMKPQPRKG